MTTNGNRELRECPVPGELDSYRRKLRSLTSFQLADFLEEILKRRRVFPELIPEIVEAARRTDAVGPMLVAKLVKESGSRELFEACKARFVFAPEAIIDIMDAVPSPEIENRLCDFLCAGVGDHSKPFIFLSPTLTVLTQKGSQISISALSGLLYDLSGIVGVKKSFADAVRSTLDGLPASPEHIDVFLDEWMLTWYHDAISAALRALESRLASEQPQNPIDWTATLINDSLVRGSEHIRNANERARTNQYVDAANYCRKAVEALLKAAYEARVGNKKIPSDLDSLRQALVNHGVLPEGVRAHVEVLQKYGNFASHDQKDGHGAISEETINACLRAARDIEKWAQQLVSETSR